MSMLFSTFLISARQTGRLSVFKNYFSQYPETGSAAASYYNLQQTHTLSEIEKSPFPA
jgi:hypothetical protein